MLQLKIWTFLPISSYFSFPLVPGNHFSTYIYIYLIPHVSDAMQYLPLCLVYFIWHKLFIHVVMNVRMSFSFKAEFYLYMYIYDHFSIHLLIYHHWSCFYTLAVMNNAIMNIGMQISLQYPVSIPRVWIFGSHNSSIFSILGSSVLFCIMYLFIFPTTSQQYIRVPLLHIFANSVYLFYVW